MTTTRLLSFQHPGHWTDPEPYTKARKVLKDAQREHWWFREATVEGEPYGRLILNLVVSGRDQWWCYRRAMKLATDCFYAMGFTEKDVPTPTWEPLEPHTNRGRYRVTQ
jgi:hypothetical protein